MAAPAAWGQEVGLRVVTHEPGARGTFVVPTADGGEIRFGNVSRKGPSTRHGDHVVLQDGTLLLIATVVLEVTAAPTKTSFGPMPGSRGAEPGALAGPRRGVPSATKGPTAAPFQARPMSFAPGGLVLYAITAGGDAPLRAAVQGTVDWRAPGAGEAIAAMPTPIARGLRPGDRVRVEVAMVAEPAETGPKNAALRFDLSAH